MLRHDRVDEAVRAEHFASQPAADRADLLDIGSLDGTAEYLAGIKAATPFRAEIVRTASDLGIADACKEAIREARGDYLVLLNNDTVVTEGWLQQLMSLANASPAVGMVGPMSNYAPVGQLVETVPYRVMPKKGGRFCVSELADVNAVHAFAREFREKNKRKWIEIDRLSGFCLLLKRVVLDRIGAAKLDQWTDLSLFDTDILSVKARQVGFTLVANWLNAWVTPGSKVAKKSGVGTPL